MTARVLGPLPVLISLACPVLAVVALPAFTGGGVAATVAAAGPAVYAVIFVGLLATAASIVAGALSARGALPSAVLLSLGLAPLAVGLWAALRASSSTLEALANVDFWSRARLLAMG
jgi:uncharacterized membrane protein